MELIDDPSLVLEEALLSPPPPPPATIVIPTTGINGSSSNSSNCSSIGSENTSSSVFASLFASSTAPTTLPSNPNSGYSDFILTMTQPECPSREFLPPSSAEMISLCLSTNYGSSIFASADQESRQYAQPSLPEISATALLQKATQMGPSVGGGSLLCGLGLMSSITSGPSENLPWITRQVKPENNPVTSGLGLGLHGNERSGLKELMIGTSSMSNQPTLDFLGLGMAVEASSNGGLSALMTSIGGSLDLTSATYQRTDFSGNELRRHS